MQLTREEQPKESTLKKLNRAIAILIMVPLFVSCGMHYNIRGQVVDAQTGEPVEGAVVAVNWIRYKLAPPGLPTPKERYGTTEDLTDAKGGFTIPKYPIGSHFMGVYKTGYICWSSATIFNPHGKDWKEMFIHHEYKVESGMVVKLEPKTDDFPEAKHASFVYMDVDTQLPAPKPLFDEATTEERNIFRESIK